MSVTSSKPSSIIARGHASMPAPWYFPLPTATLVIFVSIVVALSLDIDTKFPVKVIAVRIMASTYADLLPKTFEERFTRDAMAAPIPKLVIFVEYRDAEAP